MIIQLLYNIPPYHVNNVGTNSEIDWFPTASFLVDNPGIL
jgi:hypothetical protein